jgi:hypothetical protein
MNSSKRRSFGCSVASIFFRRIASFEISHARPLPPLRRRRWKPVNSEIPRDKQAQVLAAVHSSRRGRVGGTVLEWLKVPAGKHSPTSITEVTDKISYLKELGVDTWSLSSISNARLRAYAQAIANRPPAESRRRVEETQVLETICFLRVTLLELTDTLMYMTGRRVNDLVRHASNRVTAKQARSAVEYRQQAEAMRRSFMTTIARPRRGSRP